MIVMCRRLKSYKSIIEPVLIYSNTTRVIIKMSKKNYKLRLNDVRNYNIFILILQIHIRTLKY
jgi:hypothetical protein